jgi:hypothetical protein
MIELLQEGKRRGWAQLRGAVEQALRSGCTDAAAVLHLLASEDLEREPAPALEVAELARYERGLPTTAPYDQLLSAGALR